MMMNMNLILNHLKCKDSIPRRIQKPPIPSRQAAADKALEIDQDYSSIAEKVQAVSVLVSGAVWDGEIMGQKRENHGKIVGKLGRKWMETDGNGCKWWK